MHFILGARAAVFVFVGIGMVLALGGCTSAPRSQAAPPAGAPASRASTTESATTPATAPGTATRTAAPFPGGLRTNLFNAQNLHGWKVTDFAGHGTVKVEAGKLLLEAGAALTGVTFTNAIPTMNYEVVVEAMKVDGNDFFCGLTFPVGTAHCTFIAGGWGGGVVGLSSVDGMDASENETTKVLGFDTNRWYQIRARVTPGLIECWIDQEKMVSLETTGRKISMRFGEIELSEPLGIATYQTTAHVRRIQLQSF